VVLFFRKWKEKSDLAQIKAKKIPIPKGTGIELSKKSRAFQSDSWHDRRTGKLIVPFHFIF
jgi:hypothetical protein